VDKTLDDDKYSFLYKEEYMLSKSKQPRRVVEDDTLYFNMGIDEEL